MNKERLKHLKRKHKRLQRKYKKRAEALIHVTLKDQHRRTLMLWSKVMAAHINVLREQQRMNLNKKTHQQ